MHFKNSGYCKMCSNEQKGDYKKETISACAASGKGAGINSFITEHSPCDNISLCSCGDNPCNLCRTSKCLVCLTRLKTCKRTKERIKSCSTFNETTENDQQFLIVKLQRNLRILYGILGTLIVLILIGYFNVHREMSSIRNECLKNLPRTLDIHNYGIVLNNSGNKYNSNQARNKSGKKEFEDYISQTTVEKKIFQMHRRHKRSDMTASIHDYCRTVFNLCDARHAPGPPGVPMVAGPPGPPGPQGPKGDQGSPGPRGPPGRFGFDGIAGSPGDKGEPGEKGERGLIGFKGEKGEIGYPGPRGDVGSPGSQGMRGPPGPQGPPGPVGPTGPQGEEGKRGRSGKDGEKGDKGEKGFDGIPGVPGFKGELGEKGERGPPGYGINCICEKGNKGEKGLRGLVGFTGYKGEIGEKGQKGERGFGVKGEQGPVGPPGIVGPKGQKGDCDLWERERQDWRVVNVETKGNGKKLSDTQQEYQAHEDDTKTRGSRSSGVNSVNLASTTICSFIPVLLTVLVHLPLAFIRS